MNDVVLVPHVLLTLYKTTALGRYMGNGGPEYNIIAVYGTH